MGWHQMFIDVYSLDNIPPMDSVWEMDDEQPKSPVPIVSSPSQWDFQGPPIMGPPYGKLPILFPYLPGFV